MLSRSSICFLLLLLSFAANVAAVVLQRDMDPVIVQGQDLPRIKGLPVTAIHVYRYDAAAGSFTPVPFQVDEKMYKLGYFGENNNTLDDFDEIVFMARDLGDQAPSYQVWPADEESRQHARYEIKVTDPSSGAFGYIYIFYSSSLASSPDAYLGYLNDSVWGETYRMGHNPNVASGLPDTLIIPESAGGDGINFLNRSRLRIKIIGDATGIQEIDALIKEKMNTTVDIKLDGGVKVGYISLVVSNDKPSDFVQGPVRILRKTYLDIYYWGEILGTKFETFKYKPFKTIGIEFHYTPRYYALVSDKVEIPRLNIDPSIRLKMFMFYLTHSLNSNAFGMVYYNDLTDQPVRINDVSHVEQNLPVISPVRWPGIHWFAEVAWPGWSQDGKSSVLNMGTIFSILEFKGDPISGSSTALQFREYDEDDGPRNYGEAGFRISLPETTASPETLDVMQKNYIIPQNLSLPALADLFNRYGTELQIQSQEQFNDKVSPAEVADLEVVSVSDSSVTIQWTAVADDGGSGRPASSYSLRVHTETLGQNIWDWWAAASPVDISGKPPAMPGTKETFVIEGLEPNQNYYIALRVADEVPNFSGLSITNIAHGFTTPVELISFDAAARENSVFLNWITGSESNNLGFAIERKVSDASQWQEIGFVRGSGTVSTQKAYAFQDTPDEFGFIRYRLKQVDLDGDIRYFPEITVELRSPSEFALHQNYPNPFNPSTTIAFEVPENAQGIMRLNIYNLLGRKVRTLTEKEARAGYYSLQWDGKDDAGLTVSSGVFMYILSTDDFRTTRKMIKLQ